MYNRFVARVSEGKTFPMSYVATFLTILLLFFIGQGPISYLLIQTGEKGAEYTEKMAVLVPFLVFFFLLMLQFFTGWIGLLFGVRVFHGRAMNSIISWIGTFRWKNFFGGFLLIVIIVAITHIFYLLAFPGYLKLQFDAAKFFPFLLVSLLVFPVQTGWEEAVFRGYILPSVGYHRRAPWYGLLVSSILFALLHSANNEVTELGFGPMMMVYFSMGLLLGVATLLSEGIELAWGIHLANNLNAAVILTFPESSLQTPALFMAPSPSTLSMVLETVFFVLPVALVIFVYYRKKNFTALFMKSRPESN